MGIDPELREMAALLRRSSDVDVAEARASLAASIPPLRLEPGTAVSECEVPSSESRARIRALLFSSGERGSASGTGPGVLYMHGGGFLVGSPETEWEVARDISTATMGTVVSVDYRLAPEHPYPAALEDCYSVLVWMFEHADALGLDRELIAVAGTSAGANLAAAVALLAHERGGSPLAFQFLDMPMLDDRLQTPSMRAFTDTPMWNSSLSALAWEHYLGGRLGAAPATAAPARAQDLAGLPPTYVSVSEFDPLRDEGIAYAQALLAAGVSVELHLFAGTFHGSTIVSEATVSRRQRAEARAVWQRALAP